MTLTIEIGKGLNVAVTEAQVDTLLKNEATRVHMVRVALRNTLMDCHAGIKREDYAAGDEGTAEWRKDSLAKSMAKFEAMLRGEVRAAVRGPRVSSDPVEAEAMREARTFFYGKARGWEKGDEKAKAFLTKLAAALDVDTANTGWEKIALDDAIKLRAAKPESIAAAKAIVEAKASLNVNTEDLGI